MRNGKIIIVDDNEAVWKALRLILSREFRTVVGISDPTLLPALLREDDVDVILLDMNFGTGKQTGGEGLFWLDRILERQHPPAVVLITAFGDIGLAVASLKKGASDFIVKPWDNDNLIRVIVAAWEQRILKTAKNTGETVENEREKSVNSSDYLINQLIDFLLRKHATNYGKPFPRLTPEARKKLNELLWQGNMQLLEQSIERALLLKEDSTLSEDDFFMESLDDSSEPPITLEEMEKQFIREVLKERNGNLTLTAQQLNISRQTLYNKMRKYGLS